MNFEDRVDMTGIIASVDNYTFENKQKDKFVKVTLKVPRFSENYDEVPAILPAKLLVHDSLKIGDKIHVSGSIRTRDYEEKGHHVAVFAYIDDFEILTDEQYDSCEYHNRVFLDGTVCRETNLRKTNSGRIITDVMVAFNRRICGNKKSSKKSHESYYIPCIAWGANAKAAAKLRPGDNISLVGRFQSRLYRRKADILNDIHIAYEVSILDYSLKEDTKTARAAEEK